MMGIGAADYDTVFNASNVILSAGDPEYVAPGEDPMVAFMNAAQQLNLLMTDLATYRREHPTDDVTSALVNTNVDGEALTDTEVAAFFILLVVAGNETTRNAISHGLLAMTTYPEQRALWQADPAGIAATGVDEVVRWGSPVIWMRRTVAQDTVLGDVELVRGRQGDHVLQLGQPGRGRLRRPLHLRRPARPQPAHRVRRRRAALLPGGPPGPPGDRRHVPAPVRAAARHSRPWASRTGCCRRSSTASSTSTAATRRRPPRRADHAGGRAGQAGRCSRA